MASPAPRPLARFVAPGLLLLASLALLGGGLLPGRAFFYRDVLHYYWPTQAARFALGGLPQWNPFHQGGLPFLADIHAGVLYPPNLLFGVFSFPTAYALLLVLHHFVGQLGLFVFLRRKGLEELPALTGTLAFGLTGYMAGLSNFGPLASGLTWTPWLLVGLQSQLLPMRKLAVLSILIATQIVSGDPQSALYSALVAAVYVAWFPERKNQLVALAGAGALGLLIAGVQVFPTLALLAESTRGGSTVSYLANWNLHPLRMLEFAFPYPFGEYLGVPQFWAWFMVKGPGSIPFAVSVYLGVTVLVLAVLGAKRDRLTGFALSLCALGLLLSLGERSPVSFLLEHPPFRFFRYPEKYVILIVLGCAVLAASGARALVNGPSKKRLIPIAVAAAFMVGALLFAGIAQESAQGLFASLLQAPNPQAAIGPLENAASSVGTSLFFMATMGVLVALALKKPGSRTVALGVLALVAVDLLWTARKTVWLGPASLYDEPALAARLKELAGSPPTRLFRMDKQLKSSAPPSRSPEGLVNLREWEAGTLKSNLSGVFGLEEVSSYGAVELQRWKALMEVFAQRPQKVAELYAGCLLLTSTMVAGAIGPGEQLLVSEPSLRLAVTKLTECPQRLRTVTRTTAVADMNEALARMASGNVDTKQEALVEGGTTKTYGPAEVGNVELGPRSARARVVAPAGGTFLVFATNTYPGWTATVDGNEVDVRAVNGALMGLEVPEGAHQIEFTFTDPAFHSGLQATLAGVLLLLLLLFVSRRGPDTQEEAPAPT
ncbi:YfhO family protein [Archangium minus]|uniref:YfhO family protein n=1 Tax=Archangium minus TaxID=83450 RepID=A0ABY9X4K9_9BACT|nr:YfhO family protein [Archangium minus]